MGKREKHISSHAYKDEYELKFKRDECEFWGPNPLTMEVHVKKMHCENIRCRLSDNYEAKDKESLDIHLSTCENLNASCLEKGVNQLEISKNTYTKNMMGRTQELLIQNQA